MEHPTHQIIRFLDPGFLKSINDAQLQKKKGGTFNSSHPIRDIRV